MTSSATPRARTKLLIDCLSGSPEENGDCFEKRRASLQALSSMLADKGDTVPQDMMPDVLLCLLDCLAIHCSAKSALPLDRTSSRYFYTLLRTMQAAVSQMDNLQALSLATLVDCLRRFWTYGLAAPHIIPAGHEMGYCDVTPPASPRISSYRPPHLRSQHRASPSMRGQWRKQGDDSSASDCSETESVTGAPDPHKASQVRTASLTCLQSMAKTDGKALHPLWSAILPVYTPLTEKPSMTTLMDVIVKDPQSKVRAAAAAAAAGLMEGPRQRAYLAMAEHHDGQTLRGFTTLSAVLGMMTMYTHEGLLQALASETNSAALIAMLRFAAVLFGMTPYQRLPPTLLPRILLDMHRVIADRLPVVAACAEELTTMQCAALSCIGALLTSYSNLQPPASNVTQNGIQGGSGAIIAGVPALLAGLADVPASLVSLEALAALQPLASKQPAAVHESWHRLRSVIAGHLNAKPLNGDTADITGTEQAAVQGLRLLGCYLKACAEEADLSLADIPSRTQDGPDTLQASESTAVQEVVEEWCFACNSILPQASTHERPAVRCAAMAALGGLTDATYSCLSLAEQRQIWHSIQTCGMACASAVQAAALKAAGTLSACSSSQTYPGLPALVSFIKGSLTNPTASVQVAAAWALANAADAAASATSCPAHILTSIAEAALAAAGVNKKAQANAIRALGYLLASRSYLFSSQQSCEQTADEGSKPAPIASSCNGGLSDRAKQRGPEIRSHEADMPAAEPLQESRAPNAGLRNAGIAVPSASRYGQSSSALRIPVHEDPGAVGRTGRHQSSGHLTVQHGAACADMLPSSRTSQCNSSRTAGSIGPAWVEPGLQCLCAALQSSNVKVQWNACYAVGALLRCEQAAAAAQRAGLMQDLLQQLLQTLKHSSNFKTRAHAAAAFSNITDMAMLKSMGSENLVQSLEEASAVLQDDERDGSNDPGQSIKLDVTNIQSYQAMKQQLGRTLCHLQELRTS